MRGVCTGARRSATAISRETAQHGWTPSCCDFARPKKPPLIPLDDCRCATRGARTGLRQRLADRPNFARNA